MTHRVRFVAVTAILLVTIPWAVLLAAPMPPRTAVNHKTKECAWFFAGDECMDCFPPEGWQALDYEAECPTGYTDVGEIRSTCQPFKAQFCCSEGHSGAHGDCEDLVVNHRAKQCAFVEEIHNCELPSQWSKKPDGLELRGWFCPSDYEWTEALACETESGGAQTGTEGQATSETGSGTSPLDQIPCLGTTLVGPAVLALWLLLRRTR